MHRRRRSWSLGRKRDPLPMGDGAWTSEQFVSAILGDDATRWDRLRWRLRYLLKRPPFDGRGGHPSPMQFPGGGGRILHGDLGLSQTAEFGEIEGRLTDAQNSPLVRVVAIGQHTEAAGIRIELIALEIREAGAILYWRAFALDDQMLGLAVIAVTDEHGRAYEAWLGGGEGGARSWSGKTNIFPALAANAKTLLIKVTGFQSFMPGLPGSHSTAEGPWAFEVSIVA